MGDDRADVYVENGRVVYRASSLGGCTKSLIAQRLGYEPLPVSAKLQEIFSAGNECEEIAIKRMRARGKRVWGEQSEVMLPISENIAVVGHLDGFIDWYNKPTESDTQVLEIKSQSRAEYDKWTIDSTSPLWQRYKWQFSTYILAARCSMLLVRISRDDAENMDMVEVTKPFHSLDEIVARVTYIEEMAAKAELPVTCSSRLYPCPMYGLGLCEEIGDARPVEIEREGKVAVLITNYRNAMATIDDNKRIATEAKQELREVVGKGKSSLSNGTVINFYEQRSPKHTNYDKAKKDHPEIDWESYVEEGAKGERMRITDHDS